MNTQHTPAPWAISIYSGIIDGRGCRVAQAEPMPGQDKDEQTANAQLIAAAPELLAALQACIARMEDLQNVTNYPLAWPRVQAEAAITKAKGESK